MTELTARTGMLDCGTHPKTWELLRMTRMPKVRIELGYLTTPRTAANSWTRRSATWSPKGCWSP